MQDQEKNQTPLFEQKAAPQKIKTNALLIWVTAYILLLIFGHAVIGPILYRFDDKVLPSRDLNTIECTNVTMKDAISWNGEVDFTFDCINPYCRDVQAEFISDGVIFDKRNFPKVLKLGRKVNIFSRASVPEASIKFNNTEVCRGNCYEIYHLDLWEYRQELGRVRLNWIPNYHKRLVKDAKEMFKFVQCMVNPFTCRY